MNKIPPAAWIAVVVALGVVALLTRFQRRPPAPIPGTAPAWELADLDGKTVRLSDFAGRVVVLNFWATWCPPCRMEMPGFSETQTALAGRGLTVIGVSLDEDGPAAVRRFLAVNPVGYRVVMGTEEVRKAYADVQDLPTTFLIERSGRIVKRHVGFLDAAELQKWVAPLLESAPAR